LNRAERAGRWAAYAAIALLSAWLIWRANFPSHAFETDEVNKAMGHWSLRLLWLCLLLTPLSQALRLPSLRRWRRPLGLGAFALGMVHTVHFLLWGRIWPDRLAYLYQRPYQGIGLVALVLMIPLALTSNDGVVRRIPPRTWRRLHALVYPVAILSVVHEVMAFAPLKGEAGLDCLLILAFVVARLLRQRRRPPRRNALLETAAFSANLPRSQSTMRSGEIARSLNRARES
jgi:sulfoxide reductase heme-binding subunit YedZ